MTARAMMMMFLKQGMAFMTCQRALGDCGASAWVGLNFGGIFTLFLSAIGLLRHEEWRQLRLDLQRLRQRASWADLAACCSI